MTLPLLDWPPPYIIRISTKSKRMSLRICPYKGLEIVIPRKMSQQKAIEFLNLKFDWVQKNRHLLKQQLIVPDFISLPAISESWSVKYNQTITNQYFASEATHTLLLKDTKQEAALVAIKRWLQIKSLRHLSSVTKAFSEKCCLPYESLKVRWQRARWGSCSKTKDINLNCKLLFLPDELMNYVIVHELVHTVHFDHSPEFWAKLESYIPDQALLRLRLKKNRT
jgi:predicted metal-dependent hydrolase